MVLLRQLKEAQVIRSRGLGDVIIEGEGFAVNVALSAVLVASAFAAHLDAAVHFAVGIACAVAVGVASGVEGQRRRPF